MRRKMWFGTKEFSRWIKVHSPGSDPAMGAYSDRIDFANGGVGLRQSMSAHLEQTLTWNHVSEQEGREIAEFAYGYGGSGHLYLSDPGVMDKNVLNVGWSMPGIAAADGIPLVGKNRPEIVKNYDNSQGYPVDMAKYQVDGTSPRRSFYVPIPPGHTAWVGAHGDPDSSVGLSVQPTIRGAAVGAPSGVPVIGVDTAQRVTDSFTPAAEQGGIEISLGSGTPVTNHATTPSFETADGTAEVRRNLNPNANWSAGFTGWTVANMSDLGAVAGGRRFTGTHTLPNINRMSASAISVPTSASFMQGWMVKVAPTSPAVTFINRVVIGSTDVRKPGVTVQPGATAYVAHVFDAPAGTIRPVLEVSNPGGAAFEFTVLDGVTVESASIVRPAFSHTISPDPDFTPSATGTPNASPSILTATKVKLPAGAAVYNCIPVRSTRGVKKGNYALRLVATGAGALVTLPAPSALSAGGSARVTAYLEKQLSATSGTFPSMAVSGGASTASESVPNIVGFHDLHVTAPVGSDTVVLAGALLAGDGDVWYDCLGLFEGNYTGPYFDGSSDGASWNGTANASTSTRDAFDATLAGLIVQVLPTGVAPETGKFISGRGSSGMEVEGKPQLTPYSYAHDSYGLSMKLVETEDWK